MTLAVTSNFAYGISRPDAEIVRRFFIESVDYSNRVIRWPRIKRSWNDIRPVTAAIGLTNEDQTFNFFQSDKVRVTDSVRIEYGLQDWRHNLMKRSQEFDNASWTKFNLSVASIDFLLNPLDGEIDADYLEENSSTNTGHYINQVHGPVQGLLRADDDYRQSIYYKPNGREFFHLQAGRGSDASMTTFVCSGAGSVGGTSDVGSFVKLWSDIELLPDGWYRLTQTVRKNAAVDSVNFFFALNASSQSGLSYTGGGAAGGYYWGAQVSKVNREHTKDYVHAFASEIQPNRMNLVVLSDGFASSPWTKPAGLTATADTGASPDGLTTADTLDKTTATADLRCHETYTPKTGKEFEGWYCFSVYLQNIDAVSSRIGLEFRQNTDTVDRVLDMVDLVWSGLTTSMVHGQRGDPATGQIDTMPTRFGMETNLADNWVRIWLSVYKPTGLTLWDRLRFEIYPDYVTANTGSIRAWGAQCEKGPQYKDGPGEYLPNVIGVENILSNEDVVDYFTGTVERVSFRRGQCVVTATDKLKQLSDRMVGDGENPVIVASITPAWLAFTLCSCYGGMSATTATSNPDIDWASVDTWMDYFSSNAIHVKTRFTGAKVLETLRRIGRLTQAAIYLENNKIIFKRWTEVDSNLSTLGNEEIFDLTLNVNEREIINRQFVYADFDVGSEFYQIVAQDDDTTSQNTYGIHEGVIKDEQVNYVTSAGAIAAAQRMVANYANPFDQLSILVSLAALQRQMGESISVTDPFLDLGDTHRIMGYETDIDRNRMRLTTDKSQMITGNPFTLGTSSLSGTDVLT